jgi:hypothetical protein
MEVKGTALKTTRDFVKTKFPHLYERWLDSLTPESRNLFTTALDATAWYPLNEGYTVPVNKIIELCFDNDRKTGGEQIGSYSAETALRGFYRIFLLVASPQFLVQRASKIFTTYYYPSEVEAMEIDSNSAILRINRFDEIDETIEYRIAGWVKKALEMVSCREPEYLFQKALSKGDDATEILFSWK